MAKTKSPLFAMRASGQLAKSLVYFNWKGIDVVRQHVIPTNPRTEAQQSQRSKLATAVDEYHQTGLTATDIEALRVLASVMPTVMTYFNAFVKMYVDGLVAGKSTDRFSDVQVSNITSSGATISVKGSGTIALKVLWGVSPSLCVNPVNMTYNSGTGRYSANLENLSSGVKYFFRIVPQNEENYFVALGIYSFTTI